MNIQNGQTVVCTDNQNVETLVKQNQVYVVNQVSHRGALVKVEGVPALLAATRFIPAIPPKTPLEVVTYEDM